MKKIVLITILSFLLFSFGIQILAEETDLPSPGLLPDSPFYFLEIIAEEIITFFTFGDLKKAERYAILAAERLVEVQAVVEKGKPEFIEKTLTRYENQLNNSIARAERAQVKGQNTEKVMEVIAKVGKATSIHLEVLAEVYEKVPEQAKLSIENAMKVSLKGHEKVVEVLKTRDALGEVQERVFLPIEVPEEVRYRVQMRVQEELEIEKAECVKEGETYISSRECCIGLERKTITYGDGTVCTSPMGYVCTAFCADGKCEGEYENACNCPEDCLQVQNFEELEALCLETRIAPEQCALIEAKCKEAGAATADECHRGKDSEGNLIQPLNFSP